MRAAGELDGRPHLGGERSRTRKRVPFHDEGVLRCGKGEARSGAGQKSAAEHTARGAERSCGWPEPREQRAAGAIAAALEYESRGGGERKRRVGFAEESTTR